MSRSVHEGATSRPEFLKLPLVIPKQVSCPETDTDKCYAHSHQRSRFRYDKPGRVGSDRHCKHHDAGKRQSRQCPCNELAPLYLFISNQTGICSANLPLNKVAIVSWVYSLDGKVLEVQSLT